jgi:hypothetical protein
MQVHTDVILAFHFLSTEEKIMIIWNLTEPGRSSSMVA